MIILYPYENVIQYKEKEIKNFVVSKGAMQYGKIKNIPIFEKELKKLIKKEHWVTLLKQKNVVLITPSHYTEMDREVFTVILNNLGIKNIKYKKESALLEKKKNTVLINLHETYATVIKKEKVQTSLFYPLNIFSSLDSFLDFLMISPNKRYIFYGTNENIFAKILERKQPNVFYYQNKNDYLISKYLS